MAEKRYHIASPEQLHALEAYVKTGKIKALISVWTTTIRRTGKSPWDDKIFAAFSGDRKREARIVRTADNGRDVLCAGLHYNTALRWCEENLKV